MSEFPSSQPEVVRQPKRKTDIESGVNLIDKLVHVRQPVRVQVLRQISPTAIDVFRDAPAHDFPASHELLRLLKEASNSGNYLPVIDRMFAEDDARRLKRGAKPRG